MPATRPPAVRPVAGALLALLAAALPVTAAGPLTTLPHPRGIFHVAYSPDGRLLATSCKDGKVRLWDSAGKLVCTLAGHTSDVHSSAFSPDGTLLASASEDRTVRLWQVATGKAVRILSGHGGDVYGIAFSPDGRLLASASADQSVRIWDVASGKERHRLHGHGHRVYTVAFSPDGAVLASACAATNEPGAGEVAGSVRLWDTGSGSELGTLPTGNVRVITVAFSPDGKRLAGACLRRGIKVWELATGREVLELRGHSLDVYHLAFGPAGRRLASCSGSWNDERGGEVKVWELPTGRVLFNAAAPALPLWSVAFRPDGRRLASAGGKFQKMEPGEARLWDLDGLPPGTPPAPLAAGELEARWADLAGADAPRAYRAVWALGGDPRRSVPFLRKHVQPAAAGLDPGRIDRLVADLDAGRFVVREKASRELEQLGTIAHPALRRALQSSSAEVRRRAGLLLEKKGPGPPLAAEELRSLRAIEVLQHVGTAEVRPLLEALAHGHPSSPVTRDAATALRRLSPPAQPDAGRR